MQFSLRSLLVWGVVPVAIASAISAAVVKTHHIDTVLICLWNYVAVLHVAAIVNGVFLARRIHSSSSEAVVDAAVSCAPLVVWLSALFAPMFMYVFYYFLLVQAIYHSIRLRIVWVLPRPESHALIVVNVAGLLHGLLVLIGSAVILIRAMLSFR